MKINFIAGTKHTKEVKLPPQPASQFIPEWWKEMPIYTNKEKKFDINPYSTVTAKRCFPLLDSITSGYIIPLWADILVSINPDGSPLVKWATSNPVLEMWDPKQVANLELPDGYSKCVFKNLHGWIIETPKDYSCLMTHPLGFPNLPFKTLSGIVDTDSYKGFVNAPFVIQNGFEGIIEKGTPMIQIIPFKRDSWESEVTFQEEDETVFMFERFYTKIVSTYARHYRAKREFK